MFKEKKLTIKERGTILGILNPHAAYELAQSSDMCTDEQISEFLDICGMPTKSNEPWYLLIQDTGGLEKKIRKSIRKTIKKYYKE